MYCFSLLLSDKEDAGSSLDEDDDDDNSIMKEDVIARQEREREQATADVTNVILGAAMAPLVKYIVSEVVAVSAPSKVKRSSVPMTWGLL